MNKNIGELMKAILLRDDDKVDRLIALRSNLEELDCEGRTALIQATIEGYEKVVASLVNASANINACDNQGFTSLHYASQNHLLSIAHLLIKNGAKVDSLDVYGNTPLWRAVFASRGRGEMIRLLLDAGADRNLKNLNGVSPLGLAKTISNYNLQQFFT